MGTVHGERAYHGDMRSVAPSHHKRTNLTVRLTDVTREMMSRARHMRKLLRMTYSECTVEALIRSSVAREIDGLRKHLRKRGIVETPVDDLGPHNRKQRRTTAESPVEAGPGVTTI